MTSTSFLFSLCTVSQLWVLSNIYIRYDEFITLFDSYHAWNPFLANPDCSRQSITESDLQIEYCYMYISISQFFSLFPKRHVRGWLGHKIITYLAAMTKHLCLFLPAYFFHARLSRTFLHFLVPASIFVPNEPALYDLVESWTSHYHSVCSFCSELGSFKPLSSTGALQEKKWKAIWSSCC